MSAEAIQNLLQQLNDAPDDWSLRTQACDSLIAEGRLGEAIGLIESAPSPPYYESHVLKSAEVYNLANQPAKALPLLQDFVLTKDPKSALSFLAIAESQAKLGNQSEAAKAYQAATELHPEYRDTALEVAYGITSAPTPVAAHKPPSAPTEPDPAPENPPASKKKTSPASAPSETGGGIPTWIFTCLFAFGSFLLCWLILILVLRSMLLDLVPSA
ncbi:MAG: hypothetical protein AAGJ31_06610 [Verrucomicrobiota bacterium]